MKLYAPQLLKQETPQQTTYYEMLDINDVRLFESKEQCREFYEHPGCTIIAFFEYELPGCTIVTFFEKKISVENECKHEAALREVQSEAGPKLEVYCKLCGKQLKDIGWRAVD